MNFTVGETLVYPHHGAVTITEITTRAVKGIEKKFMTLTVHANDLTIKLPIENAELVGVRDVIDNAGVQAVFDVLRESLERGVQVKLSGFGNFELRQKNQRPGRNPKTGEEIPISARTVVTFRPGQKLKERVEEHAGREHA